VQDASRVWSLMVARLSRDPKGGLNTADEASERWAADRSRLALVVRHDDGRSERWTHFDLARHASRVSGALAAAGVQRGDRVATVLTRQVEAWIVALGAWRSGVVIVPLYGGFGADALAERLAAAEVSHIVVDHRFRAAVEEARARLAFDVEVTCVAGSRGRGIEHGDRSFWSELDRATPLPRVDTSADETATLMFTSGTTSRPKACVIPHSGFIALLPFVQHCFALDRSDMLFTTADPGWSYGLYTTGCAPMALGIPRIVHTGPPDPHAWLRVIDEEQATFVGAAPTAYRRLIRSARRRGLADSVRAASSSGEPLDADTARAWSEVTDADLRDAYGLTEMGMVLANLGNPRTTAPVGGLAGPVPGFEVDLVDGDGQVLHGAAEGVIAVTRPPFPLAVDYANAPDAWRARWVDQRFVTGDRARRDENGVYFFVGRDDDVIVTSGHNVGPAEVESVLNEHPHVLEAAAVAEPDAERGSIVRAVVVRSAATIDGAQLSEELREAVRERVGRHAEPRLVEFVDSLPRTETGKLQRALLRRAPQPAGAAPDQVR
jgi:acetyl-CoA synthetase